MSQHLTDPSIGAQALLGGATILQVGPGSPLEWVSSIRRGFPIKALNSLATNIQATPTELAQLLGVSVRTVAQRRRQGSLTSQQSERLFRLARVLARAEEVFGDVGKAVHWLKSPLIVMRGETPASLLDTELGGELVMDALGRIEHGVFA